MRDWICSQCGEWHSDHPSGKEEAKREAEKQMRLARKVMEENREALAKLAKR